MRNDIPPDSLDDRELLDVDYLSGQFWLQIVPRTKVAA